MSKDQSITTPNSGAEDGEYLICKYGGYYRPNAAGYTNNIDEAGRYTLEEAISHSHPNGPDGPRDGITYMPARHRTSANTASEREKAAPAKLTPEMEAAGMAACEDCFIMDRITVQGLHAFYEAAIRSLSHTKEG